MSNANHNVEVRNPGPYRVTPGLKMFFGICAAVGVATFLFAATKDPQRAWPNFLLNYFFFLALGLSGAFFTALQHITNAYWSVTVRRLAEALMSYLPVALVLGFVLLYGSGHLYEWTQPAAVARDELIKAKSGYLNMKFFTVRILVFFTLWLILALTMRKNSLSQDATGEHKFTLSNIKLAAFFIPVFGISFSLMSFDLIMSLEPHWYSTIFGIYCFAGLFYSGLSLLVVMVIYGRRQGLFTPQILNENHLHDLGKLMFGFTVFWAYIMFSQLMLQWYANLPGEIPYYIRRFHGGWWPFSGFLLLVHFVIPFFGLLPRGAKRHEPYLMKMAIFMLISQWFDVYYLVMPVFSPEGPVLGWVEVGTALGFLGVFGVSVGRFLEKVPAIPVKDPRLAQCLGHSQ